MLTVTLLIGTCGGVFASGVEEKENEATFSLDCTTISQEKLREMAANVVDGIKNGEIYFCVSPDISLKNLNGIIKIKVTAISSQE